MASVVMKDAGNDGPKARSSRMFWMRAESGDHVNENSPALPAWEECEVFCINGYAGATSGHCGWRGRRKDAVVGQPGSLVCPRCGSATLLGIPGVHFR